MKELAVIHQVMRAAPEWARRFWAPAAIQFQWSGTWYLLSCSQTMAPMPEAPDSAVGPATPPMRSVSLWKKILGHRQQGWVVRFLRKLDAERRDRFCHESVAAASATWLLSYRAQFRSIIQADSAHAIRYYLAKCPPAMIPLGVWLLGRCAERCRLFGLPEFGRHESPAVRRHAARALRRLEAWSQLDELARRFPDDPRIQWYAHASVIKRPYRQRLRNFTQLVDASNAAAAAGPSRMPLWFRDLDWLRRPPKSAAYIRRILMHIHRLVHGGPS